MSTVRPILLTAILASTALAQVPPPPSTVPGLKYDTPFFPGATYDQTIPTPESLIGFPVGQKAATHAQIERCFKTWTDGEHKSPRAKLFEYAKSHEARTLYYLAVSAPENIQKLDAIKADMAKLADPRSAAAPEIDKLTDSLPAVAWMAYTIHGDEMSGSDAALAMAYHLIASNDQNVKDMLKDLVILIDPIMNPDGRDRFINQQSQNRTTTPSLDDQSLLHTGFWPQGRTNHYYFDLNRDWILCTQPETRGRVKAAGEWHPQLFMESHEMGSQDSFLFSPPRQPLNPNLPATLQKWWDVVSKDQAAAFDRFGWRYYTGEWNEEWYPGYTGSWGGYRGAIDMLYEQANIGADGVRHATGVIESYREAVHHQLVSSMANLATLRAHRVDILKDYLAQRREAVAESGPFAARTFAVLPSANHSRIAGFVDLMKLQGFEIFQSPKEFAASGKDRLGRPVKDQKFPAGTILIPTRQPEARLLAAMLEFDPRMNTQFLEDERREILRFHRSKLYDVTAWSLTMLHDLDAFELAAPLPAGAAPYSAPEAPKPGVDSPEALVAYVIDGADDQSVVAAAHLMERGLQVRAADREFKWGDKSFSRGSVLVAKVDNSGQPSDYADAVAKVCSEVGVQAVRVDTGLGIGDVPDIGGEHFIRLEPPRIAVLARAPFDPNQFGEVWFTLDKTLGIRASYLDAANWSDADLRRYNVLVIPTGGEGGGADALKDKYEPLKAWVNAGGTLIAIGSSAASIAAPAAGLGTVRLLPDVLTKLEDFTLGVVRDWEGQNAKIDPALVWSQDPPQEITYPWPVIKSDDKLAEDELKRRDAWQKQFMPQGAILAARADDKHWLTFGASPSGYVPVVYQGDTVLMAASTAQAPVRLGAVVPGEPPMPPPKPEAAKKDDKAKPADNAKDDKHKADDKKPDDKKSDDKKSDDKKDEEPPKPRAGFAPLPDGHEMRLRMSGLLWPEAAERLANAAYLTREPIGSGQVILFAATPTYRGAAKGTARFFQNALIYGPGLGASHPIRP
jgi:hypothetical protein